MSRRLRLEEEKAKIKHDEDDEEDKLNLQRQRIYAPLIWKRLGSGIKIQDLKDCYYEETLNMIKV